MRALAALAILALAALTLADSYGYEEVYCVLNGTRYGPTPVIRWQRYVYDEEGDGTSFNRTFTGDFDHTFARE